MNIESPKKTIELLDIDFYFLGGQTQVTLYPQDTETIGEDTIVLHFVPDTDRPNAREETIEIYKRNLLWRAARSRYITVEDKGHGIQLGQARTTQVNRTETPIRHRDTGSTPISKPTGVSGKRKAHQPHARNKKR